LAAECVRDVCPQLAHYTTAMGLFLRIRATYGKGAGETEAEVIREISKIPLLVIDEIQERGGTAWEDRLLTHIIDKRYGAERATILIANLTEAGLADSIGDSITSRLFETGGIIELTGPSFRTGEIDRPGQQNLEFSKP
jgi:DNA replication protein DnaC